MTPSEKQIWVVAYSSALAIFTLGSSLRGVIDDGHEWEEADKKSKEIADRATRAIIAKLGD